MGDLSASHGADYRRLWENRCPILMENVQENPMVKTCSFLNMFHFSAVNWWKIHGNPWEIPIFPWQNDEQRNNMWGSSAHQWSSPGRGERKFARNSGNINVSSMQHIYFFYVSNIVIICSTNFMSIVCLSPSPETGLASSMLSVWEAGALLYFPIHYAGTTSFKGSLGPSTCGEHGWMTMPSLTSHSTS